MLTTPDYAAEHVLSDGTPVHVRHIRPDDGPALREAFEKLSPTSRYRRFFVDVGALTDEMVAYLTHCDGTDHVALVAAVDAPDLKTEQGIGVARFVRFADEPTVAEAAVTVVDDWQHRGVGKLLLAALVLAARERGILYFRAEVLASNEPMRALLAHSHAVLRSNEGETLRFDVPLDAAIRGELAPSEMLLFRLLRTAAASMVVFLARVLRPFAPHPSPPAHAAADATAMKAPAPPREPESAS
jgi:GNAT superfamily N-acetyltransferase